MHINLIVNGEPRQFDTEITLAVLVDTLGLTPATIAAMRNDVVVERAKFGSTPLADGDVVELVAFLPGG